MTKSQRITQIAMYVSVAGTVMLPILSQLPISYKPLILIITALVTGASAITGAHNQSLSAHHKSLPAPVVERLEAEGLIPQQNE